MAIKAQKTKHHHRVKPMSLQHAPLISTKVATCITTQINSIYLQNPPHRPCCKHLLTLLKAQVVGVLERNEEK